MTETKFELNSPGFRELLKSAEVEAFAREQAQKIAERAGTGYQADTHQTAGRVVASVYISDAATLAKEMERNTLVKAVSR